MDGITPCFSYGKDILRGLKDHIIPDILSYIDRRLKQISSAYQKLWQENEKILSNNDDNIENVQKINSNNQKMQDLQQEHKQLNSIQVEIKTIK
jgi:DNA repair ATPase RecN